MMTLIVVLKNCEKINVRVANRDDAVSISQAIADAEEAGKSWYRGESTNYESLFQVRLSEVAAIVYTL